MGHRRGAELVIRVARRYFGDNVGNEAAALSYYLIFSLFPLMVFGSSLLGFANISQEMLYESLHGILPEEMIDMIAAYVAYATSGTSTNLLMVSLFFTFYFPYRAMSRVIRAINFAYRVERDRSVISKVILVFVFSLFLVALLFGTLVLTVMGRKILTLVARYIPITQGFIDLWAPLRFLILAVLTFLVVLFLYVMAPNCKVRLREVLPGALFTMVLWLAFSIGFSYYVEHVAYYSVVFGSLGAMIIMLIWLYAVAVILILGAELNSVLRGMGYFQKRAKQE